MWPFRRSASKLPKKDRPVSKKSVPLTATQDRAVHLADNITTATKTISDISLIDPALLKGLITETGRLAKRLGALLQDMKGDDDLENFSGNVQSGYNRLKNTLGTSPDIIIRRFLIGEDAKIPALLTFVDGLAENQMVDQDTIALSQRFDEAYRLVQDPARAHQIVHDTVISGGHVTVETSWNKLLLKLIGGNTLLFIEGCPSVLVIDTVKYPQRSLTTPQTERSVLGPQEAFNEVILTSMNLMRLRIKTPELRFDQMTIGTISHTMVVIAHIEGLTNPELLAAIKRKLSVADIDTLHFSSQLTPLLSTRSLSLFPQVRRTERPDVVARELSMGKVAILVDNTPFAIVMPNTLMDYYQTMEDYTISFWGASLERIIRFLGLFLGLLLPPLYISLTSVNPELLPTKMVITVAGSRVGLPLPPVLEVVTMWAIIEILREAALRLPKELSTTLGTIGAIVVGTAIVKAGIVSPLMIVIITLTALGLYTAPSYEMATPWRVLFWFLIVASAIFGLFGIILALLIILAHLSSLENYGVSYLSPFGPYRWRDLKDSLVRFPTSSLTKRPSALYPLNVRKSGKWNKDPMPHPQIAQDKASEAEE